ncbi:MAG: porin [Leadbetterella sp.]|nr:porin [Leadbetterella sp.]
MKLCLGLMLSFLASTVCAQNDSTKILTFSGYAELYYSQDFDQFVDEEKPNFIYNHKKLGALNMNLAFIKANYSTKGLRGNFALMAGNYARYNLSSEPAWARIIYEANLGLKLSKSKNIWLDGGVMPAHIGFESALGADCWTLTRSLLAENSPYFETGIKLSSVSKNEKWNTAFLVLNGWQKIKMPQGISKPSFGLQINFKPNSNITLNYSNFHGSDKPDSLNSVRIFHNLFAQVQASKKLGFIMGFDLGSEKNKSSKGKIWYSPVFISRLKVNEKNFFAARIEYYYDREETIVSTNTMNGFQTFGYSLNYDYQLSEKMLFRMELKKYHSKDAIFQSRETSSNRNFSITTALTLKL